MPNQQAPNHKPRRVALISIHGDPLATPGSIESGGQNVYVYNLARGLWRFGWQVDVFSRLSSKHQKRVVVRKHNLRVIRLSAGPRKFIPKEEVLGYLPEFLNNFLTFVLDEKRQGQEMYSLIHSNYWLSGWAGVQIKRILGIPLTHTFHSLGYVRYHTLRRLDHIEDIESEIFKRRIAIEREIIAGADKLIATSTYEKQDLVKYYEAPEPKFRVIPVGVNHIRFKPKSKRGARRLLKLPKNHKIILYVGRLEWRKGIFTLIEALSKIAKKQPLLREHLLLVIAGGRKKPLLFRDKEYQALKELVEKHKLTDCVLFTGGIRQKYIVNFYAASDIVVVPSYYEPFGIIPLEAMSMQRPVIASKTGGLQYSVLHNKTGMLAPPKRSGLLARRITELLTNQRLYRRLERNTRARVIKYFTWKKIVHSISEFYISIIKHA